MTWKLDLFGVLRGGAESLISRIRVRGILHSRYSNDPKP